MEKLIQYEVLALFGIVIFVLALPYIWELLLQFTNWIKLFWENCNDDFPDQFGI